MRETPPTRTLTDVFFRATCRVCRTMNQVKLGECKQPEKLTAPMPWHCLNCDSEMILKRKKSAKGAA